MISRLPAGVFTAASCAMGKPTLKTWFVVRFQPDPLGEMWRTFIVLPPGTQNIKSASVPLKTSQMKVLPFGKAEIASSRLPPVPVTE